MLTAVNNTYRPYRAFSPPYGKVVVGFWEEYLVSSSTPVQFDVEIFERVNDFLGQFEGQLPPWEQFIAQWRASIVQSKRIRLPLDAGPLPMGFFLEFGHAVDPACAAPTDIPVHVEGRNPLLLKGLFWRALTHWMQNFRCEGTVTLNKLLDSWHQFLEITVVIHQQTARRGRYRYFPVESYEGIWRQSHASVGEEQAFHRDLYEFIHEQCRETGYFMPSHHFDAWRTQHTL